MILDWLRSLICRCPDPEPVIENTGYTGGSWSSWGAEMPLSHLESPVMHVSELTAPEPKRHLRLVDDPEDG